MIAALFSLLVTAAVVVCSGVALLIAISFVLDGIEAIAHRSHPETDPLGHTFCAPGCLRCVRRRVQGDDTPAGRL